MEPNIIYGIIILAAIVVVTVLVLVSILGRRKQRPLSDPYIESLQLLIERDQSGAFAKLQEAVKASNAPTDAYLRLGQLLRERGDAARALQIHQSLTVKSNLTRQEKQSLFLNLAEDYDRLKKPERAVKLLESISKQVHTKDPAIHFALVKHYTQMERIDTAYDHLKILKQLHAIDDRKIALYLSTCGEKLLQRGDSKAARKTLQKALKHDPACASALLISGTIDAQNDDIDSAIRKWTEAARGSQELSGKALEKLEEKLFEKGHFSEIERIYKEILESRASDERVTLALAHLYKKQGRSDDSISLLKEFLSWHPKSISASLLLLSLYAKQEDLDSINQSVDELMTHCSHVATYLCTACQFQSLIMRWHCPVCNSFDSFVLRHED